jgi:hypothetical protein
LSEYNFVVGKEGSVVRKKGGGLKKHDLVVKTAKKMASNI